MNKRRGVGLCCVALMFITITKYYTEVESGGATQSDRNWANDSSLQNRASVEWPAPLSCINGTKTILLWKNSWGYRFGTGRHPFINAACPVSNCIITQNETYVKDADFDAFVIHLPTQKTPWKLENRRRDQIFVFFSTEPPYHMPNLDAFDGYFNWTMTYLSSSDFHLRYGEIVALPHAPINQSHISLLRRKAAAANINPGRGKTKLAVWLVSNCEAPSNRQDYVRKLQQFVPVDIFSKDAKCGGRDMCPREKNADLCYDLIESTYKFYLSFENSICKEYVTEKFFEMMGRNIVPVVLGGADYASIAPAHSYIDALQFSPRQLADYLMLLDRNDTLYREYFWWKPYYRVRNLIDTNKQVFCELCAALHAADPGRSQTVTGLQKWYFQDSQCRHHPRF